MTRHRGVQLLLATAALGQFAATQSQVRQAEARPVAARLEPVVVTRDAGGSFVATAWRTRAMERQSHKLASRYQAKGYRVPPQLATAIHRAALEHGIDPQLAFGLVRAESSFRNSSTSHVGAIGLTQLMPRTAAWIEPGTTRRDLRDPETNLRVGMKYLRYLLDKYNGNTRLALLAYNRGPGTVDRVLKRGGNPDNGYVEMVIGE